MLNKVEILRELLDDYKRDLEEIKATGNAKCIEMVESSIRNIEDILSKESSKFEPEKIYEESVEEDYVLKSGMRFKNYKDLCGFMGWKTTGGNSKKARLKELDTICKWHTEGSTFVIDEVHKFILPKKDKRIENNIYISCAEGLIIYNLKKSSDSRIFITIGNLGELIGLFNEKFQYYNHEENKIDFTIANSFKKTTKAEAKRILDRCLKSMECRKLIEFTYTRIIVCEDKTLRCATVEEKEINLDVENKVMNRLGCYNFNQIKYRKLIDRFKEEVMQGVREEGIVDFVSSFKAYDIVSNKRLIEQAQEQFNNNSSKKELNDLFIKKLDSTFETKNNSAVKKCYDELGFGEPMLDGEASNNYIPTIKKLIDELIKID